MSDLSLRGATDLVVPWQSRGSANVVRVLSSRLPQQSEIGFASQ